MLKTKPSVRLGDSKVLEVEAVATWQGFITTRTSLTRKTIGATSTIAAPTVCTIAIHQRCESPSTTDTGTTTIRRLGGITSATIF